MTREFNLVESRIRTGGNLGFSLFKGTYRANKQNETKYGFYVSVSGFNFPLWDPNQIWVSEEVYHGGSGVGILHCTEPSRSQPSSGVGIIFCFCTDVSVTSGLAHRWGLTLSWNVISKARGSLLLFKRIWKFHKQNIYYLRTRWQNYSPWGRREGHQSSISWFAYN